MCFDYDIFADVYRESRPVARKRYVCFECGLPIVPGEKHVSIFSVCEGDAHTTRICAVCWWFIERIAEHERAQGCGGGTEYPPFGQLEKVLETNEFSDRGYAELIGMVPVQRNEVGPDGAVRYADYTWEKRQRPDES